MSADTGNACECIQCGRMHRFLGRPPWQLTHDDLCHLSRLFNQASTLRTSRDIHINDWLKKLIDREFTSKHAVRKRLPKPVRGADGKWHAPGFPPPESI